MKIEILDERSLINFDKLFTGQFFWKNGFVLEEAGLKIDKDSYILCTGTLNNYKKINDTEQVTPLTVQSFGFDTNFVHGGINTSYTIFEIPNYNFFIYNNKIYMKNPKSPDLNAICIAKIENCSIKYFYETDKVSHTFYEHLPDLEMAQIINPVIKLKPQKLIL